MSAGKPTRPKSAGSTPSSATKKAGSNQASPTNLFGNNLTSQEFSQIAASKILETKNGRKRAEADLQLLSNRIALLRIEEQKSLQKVEETKARAKEILEIKKRNENAVQSRIMQHVSKEMQVKEIQSKAMAERNARKKKLAATREQLIEAKKEVAARLREEQRLHEEMSGSVRVEVETQNRSKAYEERKRREALRMKQEEERKAKERALQEEVARKIESEERKRQEAERVISSLEEEERVLIARLKKTQEMQEEAIAALESSLEK